MTGASSMEQVFGVAMLPRFIADTSGSLDKWFFSQCAEKGHCIEQIGLADAIGPRDAGEGTEPQVNIQQVLKPTYFESRQHEFLEVRSQFIRTRQ